MVTVKLCGGTGNQLWQRAFGYALEALGNEVQFDRWYFDNTDARAYTLDRFNTEVPFGEARGRHVPEPSLLYQPELLKKYDEDVVMAGYWQCPKYLEGIEGTVQKAFCMKNWPSEKSLAVAEQIHNSNSVFLHIRRTDTLSERGLVNHGLIPRDYYIRAIYKIVAEVEKPHFFVFSDDIEWCKTDLDISWLPVTFVDHNTTGVTVLSNGDVRKTDNGTEEQDLWLMHLCKHAITANSSFAWWGAWRIQNPQKICIVPQQWFVAGSPHNASEMIPETWIKL